MTLKVPDIIKVGTLSEEIAKEVAVFEARNPGLLQNESDYYMPVLESWGESMYRLKVATNFNFRQHFWRNATGAGLNYAASWFGLERLEGSYPYANFTFTLNEIKTIDMKIPAGHLLGDGGEYTARVKNEVTIPAGQISAEGIVELESYVVSSEVKTELIYVPLAYLASVTQLENFHDGAARENDDSLKNRIGLALETLSAAGPVNAYKKRTLDADSRIKDVSIFDDEVTGRIQIYVDTETFDALMEQRITEASTAEEDRPLNDKLDVYQAEVVSFDITATLSIKSGYSAADVLARSKAELENLSSLKIGEDLSLAMIIEAGVVEGVKDIQITSPEENLSSDNTQVLRLGTVEVGYV